MKTKNLAFCVYGLLFTVLSCRSSYAVSNDLKRGNREFKRGNYERALQHYDQALLDAPHSPVLHFNAGAAAYQKGDASRAEREFTESARSPIPQLKSASHYNRGNTLYRQGRWDDAIAAYKDALRANPADEDAKYNLGVALRAKQNPPKQNPSQGGQNQQNAKQSSASQDGEDKKNGSTGQRANGPTKQDGMSREDAERLLSAAGSGEKKKGDQKAQGQGESNVDEDW